MAVKTIRITPENFTLDDIHTFLKEPAKISLSKEVIDRVHESNRVIKNIIQSDQIVYGVNTGFGKFSEIRIDKSQVAELQKRLVYSHAAGTGKPIAPEIVRLIMLLKIKSLSLGYSGCRLKILEQMIQLLENDIIPFIPEKGSVGASGDLAPLAHMALVMMGEGQAFVTGRQAGIKKKWKIIGGKQALNRNNLEALQLEAKEGLAVLNGTQVSTALGIWALLQAKNLVKAADIIGAVTLEGLLGTLTAFDERIQLIRPHPGQQAVAANFRKILADSPIIASHKANDTRIQDAYSLRCIPQVHGAVRDAICFIEQVLLREINSVTDNPLIFSEQNDVLSGGNFHAAPVGYACDLMCIVLTDLGSISERRIEHMQDPSVSLLPGFLTQTGGLNSGFMIAHVTAAALTSENKVLAHPASVDSIPTSANKEDHVSMATHAARKAIETAENLLSILAIELISACQAVDLRSPLKPSSVTGEAIKLVRSQIPVWKNDRQIHKDIAKAREIISSGRLVSVVEGFCGLLE
jgi:histidine ammonia-lyase